MYTRVYDNILIGASYAAIGFCKGFPGKNLIISKNIAVEDFSYEFRYGSMEDQEESKLYDLFHKKGLIREGIVNLPAASIEMYKMADEDDFHMLYATIVSHIISYGDGYELTVHNWDGTHTIRCKNLVETRPRGKITRKYFNTLLYLEGESSYKKCGGFEIVPAFYENQGVLKLEVPIDATMDEARLYFDSFIHEHRAQFTDKKIIMNAFDFEIQVELEELEYLQIPSCNFSNPIEAYEEGYKQGVMLCS